MSIKRIQNRAGQVVAAVDAVDVISVQGQTAEPGAPFTQIRLRDGSEIPISNVEPLNVIDVLWPEVASATRPQRGR